MTAGFENVFKLSTKGKGTVEVLVPMGEPLDRHPWLKLRAQSGQAVEVPITSDQLYVAASALHDWEVAQTNA